MAIHSHPYTLRCKDWIGHTFLHRSDNLEVLLYKGIDSAFPQEVPRRSTKPIIHSAKAKTNHTQVFGVVFLEFR